jgi:hypothetical protein
MIEQVLAAPTTMRFSSLSPSAVQDRKMNFSAPGVPAIAAVIPGSQKGPVSSAKYHEEGKVLYVASEADASLQVIDCLTGKADSPSLRVDREQIHEVEAT